jgi:hypothetical protein
MTYRIEEIDAPRCAWCGAGLYVDAYRIDGEDVVCQECADLAEAVNDHDGVLTIGAFTYVAEEDSVYHALRTGPRHFVLDPPLVLRLTIDRKESSRWIHGTEDGPEEAHLGIWDRECEPGAGWDGIDEVISDVATSLGRDYCDAEWEIAHPEEGDPEDTAYYVSHAGRMSQLRPRLREVDVPATKEGES